MTDSSDEKDGPFGGESSYKALELLRQYKKLNEKKMMGLQPEEEKTLKMIESLLGRALDPKAQASAVDQRRGIRVPTRFEIKLETPREVKQAYIKNLSGGGLYLETEKFQAIGSKLTIYLTLLDSKVPEPIECEVAWVNSKGMQDLPRGMGVKFHKIKDSVRTQIEKLVENMIELELRRKSGKKDEPKKK